MKTTTLVLILVVPLLFLSCKKEAENPEPVIPIDTCLPYHSTPFRIKEMRIIYDDRVIKKLFYYDSQNRLIKRVDSSDFHQTVTWKYDSTGVSGFTNGHPFSINFNLNEKGLAVRSTNGMYLYEYDSLGYLIKATTVHPEYGSQYEDYEYKCNNIISRGHSIFYEYYNNYNTIGNENIGMAYWGTQNNCLVKCEKTTEIRKSYTYKFDSLDRVVEEKLFDKYNGTKITKFKYY